MEEGRFRSFLNCIANIFIPANGKYRKIRMAAVDDLFSVASFFVSMTIDAVATQLNWATAGGE